MTELETQLLSALEQLQQDYSQRLEEWESTFGEWRTMCGLMQRDNARLWESTFGELRTMCGLMQRDNERLSGQVTRLSQRVERLSEQLSHLSR